MYVYLVRHAQSENNALTAPGLHNPSRRADPGLTRKGEAQARALERRFAEFVASSSKATVDAEIWTSCMRRCLLTTEGIARGMGTRARCAPALHEHGGCFEGARGGRGVEGRRGMTKDEIEGEFERIDAPEEIKDGWWDPARGCESVRDAQTRGAEVAKWLWDKARAMREGAATKADVVLVSHGMFIDILLKTLFDAPRTTGKQGALFCSQNACVHKLHFDVAEDGESVGMQFFNDVTHVPMDVRSGGSVDGLSEAYTKEGSA